MSTGMTQSQAWDILEGLAGPGVCKLSEYQCEGTPEQERDNPPGTMVLLAPSVPVPVEALRVLNAERVEEWPSDEVRTGPMVSQGTPDEHVDAGEGTYHYVFIPSPQQV